LQIAFFSAYSSPMENVFTMPGLYLLEALTVHAPGIAAFLGISKPSAAIALVVVLSALAWVLAVIACWSAVVLARNIYRISEAFIRTLWYRATQSAANVKTWVICTYKRFLPKKAAASQEAVPEIHFSDFDFTVLQAAAECGPGFCTSAAELADKYSLLPSQFAKSLSKLTNSKMLATAIGSTDGFDNYRITDYGTAYLQMWEKRTAN
jgi:hypothetical protein